MGVGGGAGGIEGRNMKVTFHGKNQVMYLLMRPCRLAHFCKLHVQRFLGREKVKPIMSRRFHPDDRQDE